MEWTEKGKELEAIVPLYFPFKIVIRPAPIRGWDVTFYACCMRDWFMFLHYSKTLEEAKAFVAEWLNKLAQQITELTKNELCDNGLSEGDQSPSDQYQRETINQGQIK